MKIKILTALLLVLTAGLSILYDQRHTPAPYQAASVAAQAFPPAPPIRFTTTDGRRRALNALPEQAVILHFWASWCGPCALEFPALLRQAAAADGRLAIVAISIDDDRVAMDRFLTRLRAREPAAANAHVYWVWDGDKTLSLQYFDTVRVPESVLIGPDRRMADKLAGDPGWASPAIAQRLSRLEGR